MAPFTKGHFKGVHTAFQSILALRQSSRSSHLASAKDGVENGARCAALPRDKNPVLRLSDPVTVLMKLEDWGDAGLAAPPQLQSGYPRDHFGSRDGAPRPLFGGARAGSQQQKRPLLLHCRLRQSSCNLDARSWYYGRPGPSTITLNRPEGRRPRRFFARAVGALHNQFVPIAPDPECEERKFGWSGKERLVAPRPVR